MINEILAAATRGQPTPEIGMGATFLSFSDRAPGTIIEVFKIGEAVAIRVQADTYKRIDSNGLSEMQTYEFSPNPQGAVSVYRFGKKLRWERVTKSAETGRWTVSKYDGLRIGARDRYYDFSF